MGVKGYFDNATALTLTLDLNMAGLKNYVVGKLTRGSQPLPERPVVALDISCLLHEQASVLNKSRWVDVILFVSDCDPPVENLVNMVVRRIMCLVRFGFDVLCIFDASSLPSELKAVSWQRKRKKVVQKLKARETLAKFRSGGASDREQIDNSQLLSARSTLIDFPLHEVVKRLLVLLASDAYPHCSVIQAPMQADSQIYHEWRSGRADIVCTKDSDLMALYGVPGIIRGFGASNSLDFLKFTFSLDRAFLREPLLFSIPPIRLSFESPFPLLLAVTVYRLEFRALDG